MVYNQERFILQTVYVLKGGNSSKKAAVSNQERVIMARVRYMVIYIWPKLFSSIAF